jgi:hypothetical protein
MGDDPLSLDHDFPMLMMMSALFFAAVIKKIQLVKFTYIIIPNFYQFLTQKNSPWTRPGAARRR